MIGSLQNQQGKITNILKEMEEVSVTVLFDFLWAANSHNLSSNAQVLHICPGLWLTELVRLRSIVAARG